ncbi:MAG: lipoprotein insertase outer membrane protein LolB [Gammaproteobacteria bacterium]|nr:lipoprotein insertase outer membrane protein LolB [Gammaproteobacteria bacterium]
MQYWLLIGLALAVGACSTLPVPPASAADGAAETLWQQRQQALAALQSWNLNGRIAVLTAQQGWHAGVRWMEQDGGYHIHLDAPLGQGAAEIIGNRAGVVLRTGDGEFSAESAEDLLEQRLGWRLPVSGLRYWVRGLPDTRAPVEGHTLDAAGRLTRLQQAGWDIEFKRYASAGPLELPDKIFLTNNSAGNSASTDATLEIRLVIEHWSE